VPGAGKTKRCQECRQTFYCPKGSRRVFCEDCRPPVQNASRAGEVVKLPSVTGQPVTAETVGRLETVTRQELAARGRENTTEGQAALYIARELDHKSHSGSQVAALVQRLVETKQEALKGAPRQKDRLDEIAARRAARGRAG
jgi:hypothetical protein